MDWNNYSMTDQRSSSSSDHQTDDVRVQNIHGETVDKRTKRYLVSGGESSTDDYDMVRDGIQDGDLCMKSDRVSSIDLPTFPSSNSADAKMSSAGKTVAKKSNSYERLLLKGGKDLKGESESDYEKLNKATLLNGRDSERQNQNSARKLSDAAESAAASDNTTHQLSIPADGNLLSFSIEDMAAFFRAMSVDELIVQRLQRKKLDGKKFSRLKDTVMEEIGIKNPVICYFRDRSRKDRLNFML